MRYSKDDYTAIMRALGVTRPGTAELAPAERRALHQARTAYVMHADVTMTELKIARAILRAADVLNPPLATGRR